MNVSPRVYPDWISTMSALCGLIRGAQHTIYYSAFICESTHQIPGQPAHTTFASLVNDAMRRGVAVYILTNYEALYNKSSPWQLAESVPGASVRVVQGDGVVGQIGSYVTGNVRYSNHHQKYICVDGRRMIVGSTDIESVDRAGWLLTNGAGYMWHDIGVEIEVTPAMHQYIVANFQHIQEHPPPPLFLGWSEHEKMVGMIRAAREYVHMEAQVYSSGDTLTQNRISHEFASRIARAYTLHVRRIRDVIKILIVVNVKNPDESQVVNKLTASCTQTSLHSIYTSCKAQGVPLWFVNKRLFCYSLSTHNAMIKVHSNFIMCDGTQLLRSSSNLNDRSLSKKPCDTELGVFVDDAACVRAFQQRLWNMYVQGTKREMAQQALSPTYFFALCASNKISVFRPLVCSQQSIMASVQKTFWRKVNTTLPYNGGLQHISWKNVSQTTNTSQTTHIVCGGKKRVMVTTIVLCMFVLIVFLHSIKQTPQVRPRRSR